MQISLGFLSLLPEAHLWNPATMLPRGEATCRCLCDGLMKGLTGLISWAHNLYSRTCAQKGGPILGLLPHCRHLEIPFFLKKIFMGVTLAFNVAYISGVRYYISVSVETGSCSPPIV